MSHNARRLRPDNAAARRQDDAHPIEDTRSDDAMLDQLDDLDDGPDDWERDYIRPNVYRRHTTGKPLRVPLLDAARFK